MHRRACSSRGAEVIYAARPGAAGELISRARDNLEPGISDDIPQQPSSAGAAARAAAPIDAAQKSRAPAIGSYLRARKSSRDTPRGDALLLAPAEAGGEDSETENWRTRPGGLEIMKHDGLHGRLARGMVLCTCV